MLLMKAKAKPPLLYKAPISRLGFSHRSMRTPMLTSCRAPNFSEYEKHSQISRVSKIRKTVALTNSFVGWGGRGLIWTYQIPVQLKAGEAFSLYFASSSLTYNVESAVILMREKNCHYLFYLIDIYFVNLNCSPFLPLKWKSVVLAQIFQC